MSQRILLVEDDRSLRETLADALELEGYAVSTAADGNLGTELAFSRHFNLIVLDLMLPGRGGLEILRDLREQKMAVPVLLLTVRSDENDKVIGFELGADDYVTKPFGLRELIARVKALLRRGGAPSTGGVDEGPARWVLTTTSGNSVVIARSKPSVLSDMPGPDVEVTPRRPA